MDWESVSTDEFYDDNLFRLNKIFVTVFGLWPYQDRSSRIRILIIYWCNVVVGFTPMIMYLIGVFGDLMKMTKTIMALLILHVLIVLNINYAVHLHLLKRILQKAKKNWEDLEDQEEIRVFKNYATEGKILFIVYIMFGVVAYTIYLSAVTFLPLTLDYFYPLNESRHLKPLLDVEFFVDENEYYWYIFVHCLDIMVVAFATIVGTDGFFFMVAQHVCGMFAVLGRRIDNVDQVNSKIVRSGKENNRDKLVCKELAECVQYHQECIKFFEDIEESFNLSWILQLAPNAVIISIAAVHTMNIEDDPIETFSLVMFTAILAFRLFVICWPGQRIYNHSADIRAHLYDIRWYEFPPKAKKMIYFMLIGTSRPCQLTAGKMVSLNFETYGKLMKTSMSYFTFMLSTNEE
ncbi:hypothetical protein QAD02_010838 [Eretmocerus hayati]|uniref:Uncharacterized protein n=1 Tax=Eretmocerus hayati TaxID=131215 RepID=A0ACC2NV89_9HYME|nr:hypothetical protein QAD02_010838 [Eretmocerus hayati]